MKNTTNSVNLQHSTPDIDDFEEIAFRAIDQEYTYETKLIEEDRTMNTNEKIKCSRQSMFQYVFCGIGIIVIGYAVKKFIL